MEIKKYDFDTEIQYEDGYCAIEKENSDGKYYRVEDIENLLNNIQMPDCIRPFDWECGWLNAIAQIKGELGIK